MKVKVLSCCIALALFFAGSAFAQWNLEYGEELGIDFSAVNFASSTVGYAVAGSGIIYKTVDGGFTWTEQTSPTTTSFFDVFCKSDTEVWAVGDNGLMVYTTDGTNWVVHDSSQVMTSLDINTVFCLGNDIWLACDTGVFFYSNDNGANWSLPVTNPATDDVTDISFFNGNKGYASVDGAGIMYTNDGGANWTKATLNLGMYPYTRTDIECIVAVNSTVGVAAGWGSVIGPQPTIVLVTTDGGVNWSTPDGTYPWKTYAYGYCMAMFDDGEVLISGGGSGSASPVIHAADPWTDFSSSLSFFGEDIKGLAAVPGTDRIVAVGDEGVLAISTDRGLNWDFLYNPGPGFAGLNKFCPIGKDMIMAVGTNGMLFKGDLTTDPITWDIKCVAPENWAPILHDIVFIDDVLYVCGTYRYLCKSTDLGETWTQLDHSFTTTDAYYGMHWFDKENGVLAGERAGDDRIVIASNGGATLTEIWHNVFSYQFNSIAFALENPLIGAIAGDNNGVAYTINGGTSWTVATEDVVDGAADFEEVHMCNSLEGWAVGDAGIVAKTTNGGMNWFVQPPPTGLKLMDVYFSYPSYGWLSGDDGSAFYTNNSGATWNNISATLIPTTKDANAIYFHSHANRLWIGCDYADMLSRDDIATGDETPIALPFKLGQNFPNPFNPSTIIKFSLPREGRVTLNVYNVSGRLVAKVLDRDMTEGDHEVGFRADGLVSGVYFYRLNAGDETTTKKMILLR